MTKPDFTVTPGRMVVIYVLGVLLGASAAFEMWFTAAAMALLTISQILSARATTRALAPNDDCHGDSGNERAPTRTHLESNASRHGSDQALRRLSVMMFEAREARTNSAVLQAY
jgi:hypothetical protein